MIKRRKSPAINRVYFSIEDKNFQKLKEVSKKNNFSTKELVNKSIEFFLSNHDENLI